MLADATEYLHEARAAVLRAIDQDQMGMALYALAEAMMLVALAGG